ncbi:glycogen/starch synthase [Rhodothermus marinus]|jgi:starch synthase|uniref:glycogen/starch synthase n=1 Tax=Rhodothermus marinus TaxID=29549 RepID=UPI00031C3407|nr:glycogen/starch synthase [Rhodothermus marinus]MBO2492234.1 glycogen synthase [Rhodothermus marinus]
MAQPMRILFVSSEIVPYAQVTAVAELARLLPERLQESGLVEPRIMMPRYGIVSERRNRLHEVIRLSGTHVPIGKDRETLKVKVASIPGIRLQVYFMDNTRFFKRKGVYADKEGAEFPDNVSRALFFGRAVLETVRKLGWAPDIVHAFGSLAGLLPLLLSTEYAEDPLFERARRIYTPDGLTLKARLTAAVLEKLKLPGDERLIDRSLDEAGRALAEVVAYPATLQPAESDAVQFAAEPEAVVEQAVSLYEQLLSSVPA